MSKLAVLLIAFALISCEKEDCKACKLLQTDNADKQCGYAYNGDGWETTEIINYGMICSAEERSDLKDNDTTFTTIHPCGASYTVKLRVECK